MPVNGGIPAPWFFRFMMQRTRGFSVWPTAR